MQEHTDTASMDIGHVRSYISADASAKIRLSLRLFDRHIDTNALENQLISLPDVGITPRMFIYNLIVQAKSDKQHIVLPEGNDERINRASASLRRRPAARASATSNSRRCAAAAARSFMSSRVS